ncbi:hypothetical protein Tco_0157595 [Tanacetum coccineum]
MVLTSCPSVQWPFHLPLANWSLASLSYDISIDHAGQSNDIPYNFVSTLRGFHFHDNPGQTRALYSNVSDPLKPVPEVCWSTPLLGCRTCGQAALTPWSIMLGELGISDVVVFGAVGAGVVIPLSL